MSADVQPLKPEKKLRVMSGVRTTHHLHVGNYFGAIKNWMTLQNQYECFFGVMDLHGLTTAYKNHADVKMYNRDIFADLLAWGIDPDKNTMFIQSMVPEHIELFMHFANLTPMGWLERVPTWKDAEEEAKATDTHNLGRFSYPVLQAADIAIYFGHLVPVGADQVAHLELTREIIRRFNHLYKGKLPEPKHLLTEVPLLPGLDGRKMSKSYGNTLLLTEDEKSLKKKVNSMLTDSRRALRENPGVPDECTVFHFHKLYSIEAEKKWVIEGCTTATIGCGDCKAKLCANIEEKTKIPREKKKELLNKPSQLDSIIAAGCEKARMEARKNISIIKDWMKF
ncbi:MAG: tryptophan--tRNA ligase [Bdellovibrionota bacterium]